MKANALNREEVAAFLGTEGGAAFLGELDSRWDECMALAVDCGFIAQAAMGTAILVTYGNIMEAQGVEGAARMLQINGIELPETVMSAAEGRSAAR